MKDFTSIEAQGYDTLQGETLYSARTTKSHALRAFGARKAVSTRNGSRAGLRVRGSHGRARIVILPKRWLHHLPQRLQTPGDLATVTGLRPALEAPLPPALRQAPQRVHCCALGAAAEMGINESLGFGSGGPSNH